jgi:uncharacterized protein YbdZ (MbtH family)
MPTAPMDVEPTADYVADGNGNYLICSMQQVMPEGWSYALPPGNKTDCIRHVDEIWSRTNSSGLIVYFHSFCARD